MIEIWVRQCQSGQTRVFAHIVQAFQSRILGFLYRMTQNRELAEELGQDVFMKAYRLIDRYDEKKAAFSTWLFTLARNLCLDELRKNRFQHVNLDEAALSIPCSKPTPHHEACEGQYERIIMNAVSDLEPMFREAFVLKEFEQLPLEEVAEITGCPLGTVKSRLHRARLQLQETLAPILDEYQEKRNG